jgi:hypothetical protein
MSSTIETNLFNLLTSLAINTSNKWYLKGLKSTIYSTSACSNCSTIDASLNYISTTKSIIKSAVLFQLFDNFGQENYLEVFEGKFTALFEGDYRFWGNSDDGSRILLGGNRVFDFKRLSSIDDFYVLDKDHEGKPAADDLKGSWIRLNKDQIYDFKTYLLQFKGRAHLKIGVEIRNTRLNLDPTEVSSNNIFRVEIRPSFTSFTRNLIKIEFNVIGPQSIEILNPSGQIITTINSTDTKETILEKLKTGFGAVLVVKFVKNLQNKIVIPTNLSWNDYSASYSPAVKFSEINNITNIKSKIISTESTVDALGGYAVFICFDRSINLIPNFNSYKTSRLSVSLNTIIENFSELNVIPQDFNPSSFYNAEFSITFNNNSGISHTFSNLKYDYDDTVVSNYPRSPDSKVRIIRERGFSFEGVKYNIMTFGLAVTFIK